MNLYRARLGAINSDTASWAKVPSLFLDGATYEAFAGNLSGRDAKWWIGWLAKQPERHRTTDFKPQPYEQLAKVLRSMGHEAEAKEILIEKRRLQRGAIKGGEGKWRFNYGRKARSELMHARAAVEARLAVGRKVYQEVGEDGAVECIRKWHEARSKEQRAARKLAWHKRGSGNRPLPLRFWFVAEWRNLWSRHPLLWRDRRRRYLRKGIASPWNWSKFWFLDRYDRFLEGTVGYGFKPFRALKFLFYIWAIGVGAYYLAGQHGVMTPTHPLVYQSKNIPQDCRNNWVVNTSPGGDPACMKAMPPEYSPFNAFIYSLDVGIPLVEFKQEADWSPRATMPPDGEYDKRGILVRAFQYFQIISGWVLSLLFVSAVSGIIRKD